jgi:glycolate oxidase FAD binding subunit
LIEWGGALRWMLRSDLSAEAVRRLAATAGGHATLFRAGANAAPPTDGVFAPLSPVLSRLHRELKRAFDPLGLLNPGRLFR